MMPWIHTKKHIQYKRTAHRPIALNELVPMVASDSHQHVCLTKNAIYNYITGYRDYMSF